VTRKAWTSGAAWTVGLLTLVQAFGFIDRLVIASLAEPIRLELKLTDGQIGMMGLAFSLLAALASIPLARLADRRGRVKLIAMGVALWSIMTALTGGAMNFWQMFAARLGTGFGEAVQPSMSALIAEKVAPARRASALSFYSLAIPIGAFVGAAGGGLIAQHWGWRWAFVAAGLPGLLLAVLVWRTLTDLPRRAADDATPMPSILAVIRHMGSRRSLPHAVWGTIIATFVIFGIQMFLPAWLMRRHGFAAGEAGITLGLLSSLPAMVSMAMGGFLADRLARRDARFYVWIPAAFLILCVPLYLVALSSMEWRLALPLLIAIGFLQYAQTPLLLAIVQNMVTDRMRATASALVGVLTGLVAAGGGPWLVGMLSDAFQARGDGSDPAAGLTQAMMLAACLYGVAALHLLLAARTIRADLAASGWSATP